MIKREFAKEYSERFGKDFVKNLSDTIKQKYKYYIRINTLKIGIEELKRRLETKGFVFEQFQDIPYALHVVKEPFKISSTPEYLLGYFYVQDAASMLPVIALKPKPSDVVLDCCSAPGGKSSHISQLMKNKGIICSIDTNRLRLKSQLFNLQRLGVKNVATFVLDARKVKKLGILFDKILLDPPCSASGIIWKERKRMKSINKRQVVRFAKIQKELLTKCVKVLKRGGLLVYSTCSLESEENEDNVKFAQSLGLKLLKSEYLFPHTHKTHGFYYAVLERL